jgi:DNA-binding transcriptional LysR family regulator
MESIDLGLLATLDALLQEGSVTGAARRVGLSTPAMSHALARIRERLDDPILVRAGRGMVLTPRAESLRPRVHAVVAEARATLSPERPFVPAELTRGFVLIASDYVTSVLGDTIDRVLSAEAPSTVLRVVPNAVDDPAVLREGRADLAVGIYGELPAEMRSRALLSDRFVVVARADHPEVGKRLSLQRFVRLQHLQVAPRGQPGGYIDDVLRDKGLTRHVARALPYFLPALHLVAKTDYLLTVSERLARRHAEALGLRLFEPPMELRPYALSLVWHPRFDGDEAHRFLREVIVRAAREETGELHPGARTRLDVTDLTSGETRKRPRKRSAANAVVS